MVSFFRSFFNAPDVLAVLSFTKLNNYCISCSTDTMAGLNTVRRNIATKFPKIFKTFSFIISPDTSRGMPAILRHSRLEYRAIAQHCLSIVVNLANNKLLVFFVTASSACRFETDSLSLRTSSRTVLSLSSNLTVADWDNMGRVVTQTRGRAFQTLSRAFHFLLRLQNLSRVFERLSRVF